MGDERSDPTVGELSEGQILARILERLGASDAIVGPGDDAAVLAAADGRVVASVDTLVHGPDFRLAWSSGYDLGFKAAAVNLADIAAMGATPTALLVALAMPEGTRLSFVTDLADGLRAACRELAPGCRVEGGDLTVSDTLTIAVTALGALAGREPVRRSGAALVTHVYDGPLVTGHKPSVDVLFHSVAEACGAKSVGVILTGMGRDGADGMLAMRKAGASTIGEDEASCVVYGMPKAAKELGGVEKELPLSRIAEEILRLCHADVTRT